MDAWIASLACDGLLIAFRPLWLCIEKGFTETVGLPALISAAAILYAIYIGWSLREPYQRPQPDYLDRERSRNE